jgi:hypothetical protein
VAACVAVADLAAIILCNIFVTWGTLV